MGPSARPVRPRARRAAAAGPRGQRARQPDDAGLGGGIAGEGVEGLAVIDAVIGRHHAIDAGDVHEAAAAVPLQRLAGFPRKQEGTGQVHVDAGPPQLGRIILEGGEGVAALPGQPLAGDRGVVDGPIDAAQRGLRRRDPGDQARLVGHVDLHAPRAQALRQRQHIAARPVGKRKAGALFGQDFGMPAAQHAACTQQQHALALDVGAQAHSAIPSLRFIRNSMMAKSSSESTSKLFSGPMS